MLTIPLALLALSGGLPPALDRVVERQVAAGRARGAALVIVDGDAIVFAKGYGEANPGVTVDPERTTFRIASVSKIFVAAAATELAAQGRLDLHRDIRGYLPDVRVDSRFDSPITMAQLLTHTSGIANTFLHVFAAAEEDLVPLRGYFVQRPPRVVEPPGAGFAYSNIGMALAGAVVEAIAGEPFDRWIGGHVLAPLGMAHSSFAQPTPQALAAELAGLRGKRQPPLLLPYPAGSLIGTASDMARFIIAELNAGVVDGRRVLDPKGVSEMQAHHWGDPRVQGVAYGLFESGIGAARALFHTGDSGHHGLLWLHPASRTGFYVVYLAGDDGSLALREEVAAAARVALDIGTGDTATAPGSFPLAPYSGRYMLNGLNAWSFERVIGIVGQVSVSDDHGRSLSIRPPGFGPSISADAIGPDLFRTSDGGTIAFLRGRSGTIDGVTMTGSIWDPTGFHRIGWTDRAPLTFAAVALGILALVLRAVVGMAWRKQRMDRIPSALAAAGWRATAVLPVVYVLVPVVALAGIVATPPPFTRVPAGVLAAFGLLSIAVAISALLPIAVVAAWRGNCWTRARRAVFTAIASGALSLAWALWHWGLVLGPWAR